MCQLFAHQPQRDYESQTRSLRIGGHCTSIRLEMSFWDTLEEIAGKEGLSLPKFLTKLHTEVLDHHGEVNNFASLLRCSCLIYRSKNAVVTPDFRAPVLDAADHGREERVVQVRDEHADGVGPAGAQGPGDRVGAVPETAGRGQDALGRFLADQQPRARVEGT